MFQTLKAPGRITAHMLSRSPRLLINKYVGIRPPPKNMVIMKSVLKNPLPLKSVLDIGYAANSVTPTETTVNTTE